MAFPTSPIVAGSLIGGYLVARETKRRELGGLVLLFGGVVCGRRWQETGGIGGAVLLEGIYLGAFGASHPLAKKIGAWPSVLAVSAVAAGAALVLSDIQGEPGD